MRALTVQQPWAWAIIAGGKTIENRTTLWSYRGPLAIHAGARLSDRGMRHPLVASAWDDGTGRPTEQRVNDRYQPIAAPHRDHLVRSAILGVVDLVGVHYAYDEEGQQVRWPCCPGGPDGCGLWAETAYVEHGGKERTDIVHLVLANPREFADPIPAPGRLGLWHPSQDLRTRIDNAPEMTP